MTSKSDRVYQIIEEYTMKHGCPPTVRELCRLTGYKSTSTAYYYLQKLEEQGKLVNARNGARSFKVHDTFISKGIQVLETEDDTPTLIIVDGKKYQLLKEDEPS